LSWNNPQDWIRRAINLAGGATSWSSEAVNSALAARAAASAVAREGQLADFGEEHGSRAPARNRPTRCAIAPVNAHRRCARNNRFRASRVGIAAQLMLPRKPFELPRASGYGPRARSILEVSSGFSVDQHRDRTVARRFPPAAGPRRSDSPFRRSSSNFSSVRIFVCEVQRFGVSYSELGNFRNATAFQFRLHVARSE